MSDYTKFKQKVSGGTIDNASGLPCPKCGGELWYSDCPDEEYMADDTFSRLEVLTCECGIEIEVVQVYAPTKCYVKEIRDEWCEMEEEE